MSDRRDNDVPWDGLTDARNLGTDSSTVGNSPGIPDLGAVQADDALIDSVGHGDQRLADLLGDDQLGSLLLAWRQEIDSEPIGELVDTDTAVHVVAAARNRKLGTRRRLLVPLTSAAAVLAIAFSGVGLAARSAQPGDTLWGITQVLYSSHAKSVQAAADARAALDHADDLLAKGELSQAKSVLNEVSNSLNSVQSKDGKDGLAARRDQLISQASENATPPSQSTTSTRPSTGHSSVNHPRPERPSQPSIDRPGSSAVTTAPQPSSERPPSHQDPPSTTPPSSESAKPNTPSSRPSDQGDDHAPSSDTGDRPSGNDHNPHTEPHGGSSISSTRSDAELQSVAPMSVAVAK